MSRHIQATPSYSRGVKRCSYQVRPFLTTFLPPSAAAASSRSENWASQILDNLLDEDAQSQNARVKRGGSRDRPTPPPANGNAGGARARNGAAPQRPTGFNSPSAKYAPKK